MGEAPVESATDAQKALLLLSRHKVRCPLLNMGENKFENFLWC